MFSGTSVPGARTFRTISPRCTESTQSSLRETPDGRASRLLSATVVATTATTAVPTSSRPAASLATGPPPGGSSRTTRTCRTGAVGAGPTTTTGTSAGRSVRILLTDDRPTTSTSALSAPSRLPRPPDSTITDHCAGMAVTLSPVTAGVEAMRCASGSCRTCRLRHTARPTSGRKQANASAATTAPDVRTPTGAGLTYTARPRFAAATRRPPATASAATVARAAAGPPPRTTGTR